jgi:type VI secretion system protein ImpF
VASAKRDVFLRPSVLDRLMAAPGAGRGGQHAVIGVQELRDAVRRDLDWLLNTKRWLPHDFEGLPEVKTSLLNYGMPDLSPFSPNSSKDLASLARTIEELIRCYEPRLRPGSVRVSPVGTPAAVPKNGEERERPHFRIDAMLCVDPVNEPVSFDTEVDLERRMVSVRGDL